MRIDPASLSPGRRYFLMTSAIIPRPIAWAGTRSEDGKDNLAPFSFFSAFAGTPPIVGIGFAPHEEKHEKDTLRNARRTGELSISIASFEQVLAVDISGDDLPYGESEFARAGLTPAACELIGAPRIAEAAICFECTVYQIIPLGEGGSTLLLAEIKLFHIRAALIDDRGCVDGQKFHALARMSAGRYASVGEPFKPERG